MGDEELILFFSGVEFIFFNSPQKNGATSHAERPSFFMDVLPECGDLRGTPPLRFFGVSCYACNMP